MTNRSPIGTFIKRTARVDNLRRYNLDLAIIVFSEDWSQYLGILKIGIVQNKEILQIMTNLHLTPSSPSPRLQIEIILLEVRLFVSYYALQCIDQNYES